MAKLRLHQRRWREAVELAEAGLEADPDNTVCAHLLTVALERLGKVDEALRLDPENELAREGMRFLVQRDVVFRGAGIRKL